MGEDPFHSRLAQHLNIWIRWQHKHTHIYIYVHTVYVYLSYADWV